MPGFSMNEAYLFMWLKDDKKPKMNTTSSFLYFQRRTLDFGVEGKGKLLNKNFP